MTAIDVINALGCCINNIFNSENKIYNIYTEKVKQGFKEPCFFIKPISEIRKPDIGERLKKQIKIDIMYFPNNNNKNRDLIEVMENMLDNLSVININDKLVRGSNISIQIVDDVLHFTVDYAFHLVSKKDIILMNKLYIERKF